MAFSKLSPPFKKWCNKTKNFSKLIREDSEVELKVNKEEFEESRNKPGDCLKSSEFPQDQDMDFKWIIHFYPRGHKREYSGYSSVSLHLISKQVKVFVLARFVIMNEKKSLIVKQDIEHTYEKSDGVGYGTFPPVNTLISSDGNVLIICVQVSAFSEAYSCLTSNSAPERKLLRHLSGILESGAFSDIVIRSNGTEFKVHRVILASRSDVFATMLSNKMSENLTGEIVIDDLSEVTTKNMMRFMYSCEVDFKDVEATLNLLTASDKYNLTDLKAQCQEHLLSIIDKSNVAAILLKADLHNLADLKEAAFKYICKHGKEFSDGEQYQVLLNENPMLLMEVTKELSKYVEKIE